MWGWGSSGVRTAGLGGQRVNQCICVASVGVVVARVQATGCRLVRSDMGRAGCLPRSTLLILSRTGSERRAEGVRSTVCTRYVTGTPALRAALRLVRLTTIQLWLKLVHALYQQQNTMPGALESQNKVSKSQGFFFLVSSRREIATSDGWAGGPAGSPIRSHQANTDWLGTCKSDDGSFMSPGQEIPS